MTRHIFKLVWNRKRSTMLIMIEVLICFLVLCGVLSSAVSLARYWAEPLGFSWQDVWVVKIDGLRFLGGSDEEVAQSRDGLRLVMDEAQRVDGVISAALAANIPCDTASWMSTAWIDGRDVSVYEGPVQSGYLETLGLALVYGRWLEETDLGLAYTPVVITRNLARVFFGNDDAVGQVMPNFGENGEIEEPEDEADIQRVVGVIGDVKRWGELDPVPYMVFYMVDLIAGDFLPGRFVVRVQPGTGAEFEERFVRAMQRVAPQWAFSMGAMEDMRHGRIMSRVNPLLVAGVIAAFLIIMVGLGLVGVLWQSVARRTAELGVRRALGASAAAVRRQVLGELWALTTMSVAVGTVLFLQLPLIGVNFGFGWPVYVGGLTTAALVIYGFVTICGLYPTWLATRVHPAEALQYE